MELSGKSALVTGGAQRVGRAIVLELARAGCDIAIGYRSSSEQAHAVADEVRSLGCKATLIQADLADLEAVATIPDRAVAELGRLDILVNNASLFKPTPIDSDDATFWQELFRVNVLAPALLARKAAPHMRQQGRGAILNLTDILADRPMRDYDIYCASKAALASLNRSLARELAPEITVNAIAPGVAAFPDDYDAATQAKILQRVPLRRGGTPDELAKLARTLLESGDYVTGQILPFDGGRSVVP